MRIEKFEGYIGRALGFAKPTRYFVEIGLAKLLKNDRTFLKFKHLGIKDLRDAERLGLFCDVAELPGRHILTQEARTYGPVYQAPYMSMYDTLLLQFYVGRDMKEKKIFEAWQNCIHNPMTNNVGYMEDYCTDIRIKQLDDLSLNPGSLIPGSAKVQSIINEVTDWTSKAVPWIPGKLGGNKINNGFNQFLDLIDELPATYEVDVIDAYPISVRPMGLAYTALDQIHRIQISMSFKYWRNVKRITESIITSD